MKSTLFFNNFTCLDCAIIDNNGWMVGASFHPSAIVSGDVTLDESVVIDFSAGKKKLKEFIDCKSAKGLDHKLILIEGFSKYNLIEQDENMCVVTTDLLHAHIPKSDLHIIKGADLAKPIPEIIAKDIERYFMVEMPEFDFKVSVNQIGFTANNMDNQIYFRYTHGLKDSTSYGCKNIAHGHLSFFEITEFGPEYREDCEDCRMGLVQINKFFEELNYNNSVMFVNKENIVFNDDDVINFEYNTPRGLMECMVFKNSRTNIRVLETETTVEYIAEWLKHELATWLHLAKVKQFRVSEGLQKGAIINL